MPVSNRDIGSLWDMVNAINRIQEFTANLTEELIWIVPLLKVP
jgi:hypothetical protein